MQASSSDVVEPHCAAAASWDSVKYVAALGDGVKIGDWHPGI